MISPGFDFKCQAFNDRYILKFADDSVVVIIQVNEETSH